jgi:hypothetical protein
MKSITFAALFAADCRVERKNSTKGAKAEQFLWR